jgi:hypothetical protein
MIRIVPIDSLYGHVQVEQERMLLLGAQVETRCHGHKNTRFGLVASQEPLVSSSLIEFVGPYTRYCVSTDDSIGTENQKSANALSQKRLYSWEDRKP